MVAYFFRALKNVENKNPSYDTRDFLCYFFGSSLCGLWLGQVLFEHRSGMVFVPSILRLPQSSQILPVGLALMAFLQSG